MRDDFTVTVKRNLAKRVGYLCSNPNCQRLTIGPSTEVQKSVTIGVAAHITAASPGGPRYDPNLTSEERKGFDNGIWLCEICAKLADADPRKYHASLLSTWKLQAENRASKLIEGTTPSIMGIGQQASYIVLANQLDALSSRITDTVEQQLELKRTAWREGRRDEATRWVTETIEDTAAWEILSGETKAKVMRFQAVLTLETAGDTEAATRLADQAHGLVPLHDDSRLRALIAYREDGHDSALEVLEPNNDIESLNLKGALLLEKGRPAETLTILSFKNGETKPNAETLRVRALAHLTMKDQAHARLDIQKALEIEPTWESIRLASGIVGYFSGLAVAAMPDSPVGWPEPTELSLVKCDDESIARLKQAEELFQELAAVPGKDEDERRSLETWRLACLSNDIDRREEAIEYCGELLDTDATHYGAVIWSIARQFDVDLSRSEKALEKLVAGNSASVPHILALTTIYLESEKAQEALEFLTATKPRFEELSADVLWTFWYAQSLVLSGDPQSAILAIDASESSDQLRHVRTIALRAIARENENWDELMRHLEESYDETGNPSFLFECCRLKAWQNDWRYVADRALQLTEEIGTTEALRLTAIAAFNAGRYELCLTLLSQHRNLFSNKRLPAELRRLRIYSQQALGILPDAIAEGEALAREHPSTENLLALCEVYFGSGDLKALSLVARQLTEHSDLSSVDALRIARLVQLEDKQLSIALWRQAILKSLPDDAVGIAVSLGFQLGMDEKMNPLMERMARLGQQKLGGIHVATLQDFITLAEHQREQSVRLQKAYQDGSAPIHLIMQGLNRPLVEFFHTILTQNEKAPDPIRQFALLIRHGGRPLDRGFPKNIPEICLNIDITGLLLAEHFDILPQVEKGFKSIRLPAESIPSLIQMRDNLLNLQPSRLEAYSQIVDLADRKKLYSEDCQPPEEYSNTQLISELGSNWVGLFERAHTMGGFVLDFSPLTNKSGNTGVEGLPNDSDQCLVNCRSVIEVLRQHGPLSSSEYEKALVRLGDEGRTQSSKAIPQEGAPLYCYGNTPEVLASAGVLDAACDYFNLLIEQRELDGIRATIKYESSRKSVIEWLTRLIDKLRKGIKEGVWEIIPASSGEQGSEIDSGSDSTFSSLLTLMRFTPRQGDVIWSDDRHLNSFLRRDNIPIVGINDVLKGLVGLDILQVDDYYRILSRMREANIRFVPVEKEEILRNIQEASVKDGCVVETRELRALRRHLASCLLQGDILQKPPMPEGAPNENGELAFLLGLGRSITDALVGLWSAKDVDDLVVQARAEWLLSSLYVNHIGLFAVDPPSEFKKDDSYLAAISLAGLVSQAIILEAEREDVEDSQRKKYLGWLYDRILRKCFDAEPQLLPAAAGILKRSLFEAKDIQGDNYPDGLANHILRAYYDDLPGPIRDELAQDTDFMESIGLRTFITARMEGLAFERQELVQAVRDAVNGKQSKIKPAGYDEEIVFEPREGNGEIPTFGFEHPHSHEKTLIRDPVFGLLLKSPTARESVLQKNRHWFDCSVETLSLLVAEIASIEDPVKILEQVESWRKSSASVYYGRLGERLRKQEELRFGAFLPPSAEGLLRHHRIPLSAASRTEFRESLAEAAKSLVSDEGLLIAIERLLGFPIPLPSSIIEAFSRLSVVERRSMIDHFIRFDASPLSRMHLIHILFRSSKEMPDSRRLGRRLLRGLFTQKGVEEVEAFLAILKWSNQEFCLWSELQDWPPHIRLAMVWAHANRLSSIFISLGAETSWVKQTFTKVQQRLSSELYERGPRYWFDIAHPRRVNRETFFVNGLFYCVGENGVGFIDQKVNNVLGQQVLCEIDDKRLPSPRILRDSNLAANSLESFLGGDLGDKLISLFGDEEFGQYKGVALKKVVQQELEKLSTDPDNVMSWALVNAVLGDLPLYKDMRDLARTTISNIDFAAVFETNSTCGRFALQTVTLQMVNIGGDSFRQYLKDQLLKIAGCDSSHAAIEDPLKTTKETDLADKEETSIALLEAALNISLAVPPSVDTMEEFSNIVTQLVQTRPSIVPLAKPIIQRLHEELPVSTMRPLWPLLILLRTE